MSIVEQHAQSMLVPAKGWKRPKVILPDLPAELWMVIFREATWVPNILDPDSVAVFCPLTSRQRIKSLRASLVTKRYLVRVCKRWYSLATPYLYESVIIGRCRTLKSLSDALPRMRRPEGVDTGKNHSLGWWTKRLDVAMRDKYSDLNSELESLSQIIQYLPNLNILIFRVPISKYLYISLPDAFLHHLSRSAGPNLEAIVWYTEALTPHAYQWYDFLGSVPNIRTLSSVDSSRFPGISPPALPALRTLDVSRYYFTYFPNSTTSIPSLRHLIIICSLSRKIFLNHGQQLEVVQVHVTEKGRVSHVLNTISQLCPKVHRLDISIPTWGELNLSHSGLSLPTTIRTFGIYCTELQASRTEYQKLFGALRNMKCGPTFKVIQLLHANNVTDLRLRHRQLLATNVPKLNELGFEVQDHEGQLLY